MEDEEDEEFRHYSRERENREKSLYPSADRLRLLVPAFVSMVSPFLTPAIRLRSAKVLFPLLQVVPATVDVLTDVRTAWVHFARGDRRFGAVTAATAFLPFLGFCLAKAAASARDEHWWRKVTREAPEHLPLGQTIAYVERQARSDKTVTEHSLHCLETPCA